MNNISALELHKAISNNRVIIIIGDKVFVPDDIEMVNDYFDEYVNLTTRLCTLPCSRVPYHKMSKNAELQIKDVIFNDPATIVFWSDGTKTVVKAQDDEMFDPEKGLSMAISKKTLGNKGSYYKEFDKWLPEDKINE